MKKISVIGTGYVGLVTGVCFAELGHQVHCIDVDKQKIEKLKQGISPIYEPGIEELLAKNIKKGRITFYNNTAEGVADADIVFIAVGTPSRPDGTVETKYVEKAAAEVGKNLSKYAIVINKSTVPVGTGEKVAKILAKHAKVNFDVVSNPEFLREGQAISDFMKPDRVVIGSPLGKVKKTMQELYAPVKTEIFFTDLRTAELIKYASNAYLAASISFINSLASLCEEVGANADDVAAGMRLDRRIGKQAFLSAGPGYGGSCFPKDVKGLIGTAALHGIRLPMLETAEAVNVEQADRVWNKLVALIKDPAGKRVAVWGLAFKPETDDLRESPAAKLVERLLAAGAEVVCFDPVAEANGRKAYPGISFGKDPLSTLKGAECLAIMTEWSQFRDISLTQIKKNIKKANLLDARNIYKKAEAKALGFKYEGIGQ